MLFETRSMDRQKELLELCKPLSIKLTRISHLDINKWKQRRKQSQRSSTRRNMTNSWQKGNYRRIRSQKKRKSKKYTVKCVLSDTDDELSKFKTFNDSDNEVTWNRHKKEKPNTIDRIAQVLEMESAKLPKNNMSNNDKIEWKYKRKRRRASLSFDNTAKNNENIEVVNPLQINNSSDINGQEVNQVNLGKEIKIVSSRLEDSDDPQIEKWRSKKKPCSSQKSKTRIPPKLTSLNCTVCSVVFDSKEELSNHIFKHTQRELQEAYKAAKIKLQENDIDDDIEVNVDEIADNDKMPVKHDEIDCTASSFHKEISQTTQVSLQPENNTLTKISPSKPVICSCHSDIHSNNDESVQIEMVLFCETCHVLFRRSECFETHYRFSSICNADRTKGRTPKLFCSTCRIVINTLSNMREHLEEHARVNFHGTVTFVCNICRVVFFGVGTVFCTHWFNHEKDPTFVASRYSFPKLCVSTQGTKPFGSASSEQYFFVAEYVCRLCKFQFSSESELTIHMEKDCKSVTAQIQVQNKSPQSKTVTSNLKSNKLGFEKNRIKIDSLPSDPLDVVNKWICEFCKGCYSNRASFDEHSTKHLQEDGYPGYHGVFQWNATTACICNVCRGVYNNLQDLMNHWITHEVIKFICSVCNEKCSSYRTFGAHISLSCWKFKPDCHVWFNRQHRSCIICKSTFETAEKLAHHYTFDHTTETVNKIISQTLSRSSPIVETSPVIDKSTSLTSVENKNQRVIEESTEVIDKESQSVDSIVHASAVGDDIQTADSDIENSIHKESPMQEISTIKVTIPNLIEKPAISCQDHSTSNPINFHSSVQSEISSEICESTSDSVSINSFSESNTSNSPSITKRLSSKPLNVNQSAMEITIRDTCLHGSKVITTNTADVNNDVDNPVASQHMNIRNLQLFQSIATASINSKSPIKLNSLKRPSVINCVSGLNNGNNPITIISEPKIIEKVNKIADKVVEISESDESDIIEISNNAKNPEITSIKNKNICETELTSKECELENQKSSNSSNVVDPLNQEASSNTKDARSNVIKSINDIDEFSNNSDASRPRGFLRVKKFTELQAVRNYICTQCAAAFDNIKSLEEHVIAHDRRMNRNEKHPTMMAALILPQVDPNNVVKESTKSTALPDISQIAEKRILPCVPQRITNENGRQVSILMNGPEKNSSQNIPPMQNETNIQNIRTGQTHNHQLNVVFPCGNPDNFNNHLSANNSNLSAPIPSANLIRPNSFEKQKIYTCKVCKYTTLDKERIVQHVKYFHLGKISQTNIHNTSGQNTSEFVQQLDFITPPNNGLHLNTVPPYRCNLCTNYQYSTLEEFAQHFQTMHSTLIPKNIYQPYVCNICFFAFPNNSELISHLNGHQNLRWT